MRSMGQVFCRDVDDVDAPRVMQVGSRRYSGITTAATAAAITRRRGRRTGIAKTGRRAAAVVVATAARRSVRGLASGRWPCSKNRRSVYRGTGRDLLGAAWRSRSRLVSRAALAVLTARAAERGACAAARRGTVRYGGGAPGPAGQSAKNRCGAVPRLRESKSRCDVDTRTAPRGEKPLEAFKHDVLLQVASALGGQAYGVSSMTSRLTTVRCARKT